MHPLKVGNRTLVWGEHTFVMGILNLTPDSFSGDGLLSSALSSLPPFSEIAQHPAGGKGKDTQGGPLEQARRFMAAGVDILDIGGESTRPGSQPVDAEEELRRVLPTLHAIAAEFPVALISIDTYKAEVAEAALQAGAHMINDIWGLRADPDLAGWLPAIRLQWC
jgi:dihydropteroate synthase